MRSMSPVRITVVLACMGVVASVTAKADTFTLKTATEFATFSMPASPAVVASPGVLFRISSVEVDEGGLEVSRDLSFFNAANGGGLLIEGPDGPDFNGEGPVLFTGAVTAPTFRPGTFSLKGVQSGVLTITPGTVTPEPMPFLLVGTGLGLLFALRRAVAPEHAGSL